ncbi:MAG: Ig-like domain-containing protein, partial [Anaerolineales bacterium]
MKWIARTLVLILILLALAGCNFPIPGAEPTPLPDENLLPAVSVGPLPPEVVETTPMDGSRLSAAGEIDIYFNQPMNRASVEGAITSNSALNGSFTWVDDLHLVFKPAQPWPANSEIEIAVGAGAKSADGLAFEGAYQWRYQSADYLRLVQALPEDQTQEIDPGSEIVASFNQPVVPLGAASDLPAGFTISPEANGRGEWLNTSTYIFYPNPALTGGQEYTVTLNPDLASAAGTSLDSTSRWTFRTLSPGYRSYSPQLNELHVRLDAPVTVTFNQAMDPKSVEDGFILVDQDNQGVSGKFTWSDDFTTMTFQPNSLYKRGERYTFHVPTSVRSAGGTMLSETLSRSFYAAMELFVLSTYPENGGTKQYYSQVSINFNAPLDLDDPAKVVTVTPDIKPRVRQNGDTITLFGNFVSEQSYTVTVAPSVKDIWGDELGYEYSFSFTGAPQDAAFRPAYYQGSGVLFVNPDDPLISAQVVNVDQASVMTGSVPLELFLYLENIASYDERDQFVPDGVTQNYQTLQIERNRNQIVGLELNQGRGLTPGIYWVKLDAIPSLQYYPGQNIWAVVSHVQLVFKISAANALVWAVDTRNGTPVSGQPVRILDNKGNLLASGTTDGTGLFNAELAEREVYEGRLYAELGSPGDDLYSLGLSTWNQGISGWDFGYYGHISPPEDSYYLYTDRPIYRPGQEVDFKVIVREAFNGRYSMPGVSEVKLQITDGSGAELETMVLPLSEFGTAAGSYQLPAGAVPGFYDLRPLGADYNSAVTFQVANYRKPEVEINLAFDREDVLAGDQLDAEISSRYYFDAPAAGNQIGWNVYARDAYFSLPGYHVGPSDGYYSYWSPGSSPLGEYLIGGNGVTGDDGRFAVSVASEQADRIRIYTLETVVMDESGFTVSNRTETTVHPEMIYIGVDSDSWIGQAGTDMGFDIRVVDWEKRSAGVQNLSASFGEVTWEETAPDLAGFTSYEKVVKELSHGDFQTSEAGLARLSFTPADPGVYQLTVTSGNALTEYLIWVGGPGTGVWPDRDGKLLELLVDAESYKPGEVATVFVPNPFPGEALALVTYERGEIMDSQILKMDESGMNVPVVLTEDSAPNIFVTVTLIGVQLDGKLGYRYGMVNIPVDPEDFLLQVEVLGEPERTAPGEPVTMQIRVTDNNGSPVQGEFSLAVVDEAVLALVDRFEQPIEEAFYGEQDLGVLTGISLVADAELFFEIPGGLGGGGGDLANPSTRSDFED